MANVRMYKTVNGMKAEKFYALHPGVQMATLSVALKGYIGAKAQLARHRSNRTHHSFISLSHGRVDWYVILDDRKSDWAAAKIMEETQCFTAAQMAMRL